MCANATKQNPSQAVPKSPQKQATTDTSIQISESLLPVFIAEMNNRSRFYVTQLWQVPFAYFAVVGVFIGSIADKSKTILWVGLLVSAVFGLMVLWHMVGLKEGTDRAVANLASLEGSGRLIHIAQNRPFHFNIFMWTVGLAAIFFAVAAYKLW
jgi:hypothetical protein